MRQKMDYMMCSPYNEVIVDIVNQVFNNVFARTKSNGSCSQKIEMPSKVLDEDMNYHDKSEPIFAQYVCTSPVNSEADCLSVQKGSTIYSHGAGRDVQASPITNRSDENGDFSISANSNVDPLDKGNFAEVNTTASRLFLNFNKNLNMGWILIYWMYDGSLQMFDVSAIPNDCLIYHRALSTIRLKLNNNWYGCNVIAKADTKEDLLPQYDFMRFNAARVYCTIIVDRILDTMPVYSESLESMPATAKQYESTRINCANDIQALTRAYNDIQDVLDGCKRNILSSEQIIADIENDNTRDPNYSTIATEKDVSELCGVCKMDISYAMADECDICLDAVHYKCGQPGTRIGLPLTCYSCYTKFEGPLTRCKEINSRIEPVHSKSDRDTDASLEDHSTLKIRHKSNGEHEFVDSDHVLQKEAVQQQGDIVFLQDPRKGDKTCKPPQDQIYDGGTFKGETVRLRLSKTYMLTNLPKPSMI